jgi:Kef-type K+ transport system membrane component KefB
MSFEALALISAAALAGPLLASRRAWHLPVVLGELLAGILLGATGLRLLDPDDPTFTFLADIGFALIMFVAGTHVPIRDPHIRPALVKGMARAVLVGAGATLAGFVIAQAFGTGHAALYAVLIASSSAALVLPLIDSIGLEGTPIVQTVAQVAVADIACIVALPLVIDPAHAPRAAAGAVAVTGATAAFYAALRASDSRGWLYSLHQESKERGFALELRINIGVLCLLAALAVHSRVSIMLAGFALGLVIAAVGEPRRLAKQLFSITEGFFGPLFFVWLGASLNVRDLGADPSLILLGIALGLAAVLAHCLTRLVGVPLPLSALAAAQLGVPVAAAAIGAQSHLLDPGEPSALILGALVTIATTTFAGSIAARRGFGLPR